MKLRGVVLDEYHWPEREWLRLTLLRCTTLEPLHAGKAAACARGIVVEALPEDDAFRLAAALTEAGFPARTWPTLEFAPPTQPKQARTLELGSSALKYERPPYGPKFVLPWSEVHVLSLGLLVEETREVEVEAIHVGKGNVELVQHTKYQRDRKLACDLIGTLPGGAPLHLRLVANDFNYQRTLGVDQSAGWRENFTRLLARLGLLCTNANLADDFESFILHRAPDESGLEVTAYHSEAEYLTYVRWLWQRQRMDTAHAAGD